MKLEEKLVSLRKEKGLSQLKLAEMMNVSRQAVSRWEAGTAVPSTDNLKYLGLLYGVTLEYLLYDDATDMTTSPQAAGLNKNCTEKKKLWKRNWAGITILFLLLLGVVSFLYINWGKEETIPIESLESDDGWTNADVDGFSIDW